MINLFSGYRDGIHRLQLEAAWASMRMYRFLSAPFLRHYYDKNFFFAHDFQLNCLFYFHSPTFLQLSMCSVWAI